MHIFWQLLDQAARSPQGRLTAPIFRFYREGSRDHPLHLLRRVFFENSHRDAQPIDSLKYFIQKTRLRIFLRKLSLRSDFWHPESKKMTFTPWLRGWYTFWPLVFNFKREILRGYLSKVRKSRSVIENKMTNQNGFRWTVVTFISFENFLHITIVKFK